MTPILIVSCADTGPAANKAAATHAPNSRREITLVMVSSLCSGLAAVFVFAESA
jgi:hypothetical protein